MWNHILLWYDTQHRNLDQRNNCLGSVDVVTGDPDSQYWTWADLPHTIEASGCTVHAVDSWPWIHRPLKQGQVNETTDPIAKKKKMLLQVENLFRSAGSKLWINCISIAHYTSVARLHSQLSGRNIKITNFWCGSTALNHTGVWECSWLNRLLISCRSQSVSLLLLM